MRGRARMQRDRLLAPQSPARLGLVRIRIRIGIPIGIRIGIGIRASDRGDSGGSVLRGCGCIGNEGGFADRRRCVRAGRRRV